MAINIDFKDEDDLDCVNGVLDLIRKFDRYSTTIVGTGKGRRNAELVRKNPRLCTFMGSADFLKLFFGHFTLTACWYSYDCEAAQLPYMTRGFVEMIGSVRSRMNCCVRGIMSLSIFLLQMFNLTADSAIDNLNRRGIFTSYWVLNEESEAIFLALNSSVQGIMTDRPKAVN